MVITSFFDDVTLYRDKKKPQQLFSMLRSIYLFINIISYLYQWNN